MSKSKEKLLIIDAHALIHRAYHALPPLTTSKGEPINAVYGYLLILMSALKNQKPTYVAVTFDSKGKTFRHKRYKKYKANRQPAPDDLVSQFPLVHKVTKAFGFPTYAVPGFEADDLIGTICEQLEKNDNLETIIVTGDHDLLQLVDNNTKVMKLQKGVKNTLIFDEKMVKEKTGLSPIQIIDYKGLRGDASDNIPGVAGIGDKGATTLLQKYGTIENIFNNVDKITGRNRKPLEGSEKDALLSKELATIVKNAPITFNLEETRVGTYNQPLIKKLFKQYEFKTLLTQLNELPGFELKEGVFERKEDAAETEKKRGQFDYQLIQSIADIQKLAANLKKEKIFAFDTETTGLNPLQDDLVGISFSWKAGQGFYLPCGTQVPKEITAVMEDPSIKKTAHNMKFDVKVMQSHGVQVAGIAFDSMLASYLCNAESRGHSLDNLAFIEFGHHMQPITELIGKGKNQITMADVPIEKVSWYAAEDADFTWRLYQVFKKRIHEIQMDSLLNDMELPLIDILSKMEIVGVQLDVDFLNIMSKKLHKRIKKIEKDAYRAAGSEFNLASPTQLKNILFEKLMLPTDKIKKTKSGYSTAAPELEKLKGTHPIIELIQENRELSKLTSTYIDTLPKLVNPKTGRVHTNYSQTITATGRLSSSDPNLQNIPIRTELGREIRKAFIAPKGYSLLSIDYSQIELRVVAHLSKDTVMMEAFKNGEDIHTRTAAELNGVQTEEVTKEMRRQAKAINFGILYGMGVQGIMRDSGISREEARNFLDTYFTIHTGIAAYIEKVKTFTHEHQYAETLLGRRRPLPGITSSNRMIMTAAERAAVNMPVQGTAADLMKIAMIKVQKAIDSGTVKATMLLQVHDELLFEVKNSELKKEAEKIKRIMENAYPLDVPLTVDVEAGINWGELERL